MPTNVRLDKVMVFPVAKYGSKTIKYGRGPQRKLSAKELMLLNCGVGEDS